MWKNYFKTTFRNLIRNKLYAGINIFGLTVGITCFALIFLYVENELSYDAFHENESYRFLVTQQTGDGESRTMGIVGLDDLNQIAENVAGIKDVLILRDWGAGNLLLGYEDQTFKTRQVAFAESDFFDYYSMDLVLGDKEKALSEPNNVIISTKLAGILFGDDNPIGKTITTEGNMSFPLIVAGVFEKVKNSHLSFEMLMNLNLRDNNGNQIVRQGFSRSVYGYFKLEDNADPDQLALQVKTFFEERYAGNESMLQGLEQESYSFQSIYDIYFGSDHVVFDNGLKKGSKDNLYLLSIIGFFTLLIACMNYINAATAKSITRAKEIGVRKVFGAFRNQLVTQFIGEAFVITLISVILSVLITDLALPSFKNLVQTDFRLSLMDNPAYPMILFSVLIGVTLLSGLYPAFVISRFNPSQVLKSQAGKGVMKGSSLRSVLVGFQLFLTMLLISGVLLILKQTRFINDKDLGFSTDDIVIIPNNSPAIGKQVSSFKNELLKSPYIEKVTSGMDVLGFDLTNNSGQLILEGQNPSEAPVATFFTVGMDFIDVQGIEMLEGRTFNPELKTDSVSLIVNEAYMRSVGKESLIGEKAHLWSNKNTAMNIIGVTKDFNFRSLRSEVSPAVFWVRKGSDWFFTLKINPEYKQEAIAHAQKSWDAIDANFPMGHMFLEDNIGDYYSAEKRLMTSIEVFALICIFIACLGLYGMTSFTIERRIKEIGVRKVLGAQVSQLLWLINSGFLKIVVVASILAIPLVYYLVQQWLQSFAYHMNIGWFSFLMAFAIVSAIVLLTVSSLAIQASRTNPAKTLRSE